MKERKKVLFFVLNEVGGAERVTVTFAKSLPKEDYEVKFVVCLRGADNILNFIPDEMKDILRLRRLYFGSICEIVRILKTERPYAVFVSSPAINSRVIIAAKIVGNIKTIIRNSNMYTKERIDVRFLMRLTYPFADKIVLQQEEMQAELLSVFNVKKDKTIVLHNPIDTESIEKLSNVPSPFDNFEGIKIVNVGRFSREKGQDVLAEAFALFHKSHHNSKLYFVGRYREEDKFFQRVREIVESNDIMNNVEFVHYDSNPYRWMKYCDCFVLPSRYEGLPNVLIEAMFLGKKVVSTSCIPIVERIVQDGYNGILVPIESPSKLCEGMERCLLLGSFNMIYKPTSTEDIVSIF